MSSALTYIVLGYFGGMPNGSLILPAPSNVFPNNRDPLEIEAGLHGYTYSAGIGAHKVITKLSTWNIARRNCEEEGGHMVIINSENEARHVAHLLNEARMSNTWVGIHDHFQESEYVTIRGESLVKAGFDQWASGEPNNVGNNEHCGVLNTDGKLLDIDCNSQRGTICELFEPCVQKYLVFPFSTVNQDSESSESSHEVDAV